MLGEMIGELRGKITGHRVLSVECCPKIESSFQDKGTILGVEVTSMGTFWTIIKEDGMLYGEGQGVLFADGDIVTLTAQGIGKMKGNGAEWKASVYFDTSSEKLVNLNNIVGVAEFDVDEEENTHIKIWEWK